MSTYGKNYDCKPTSDSSKYYKKCRDIKSGAAKIEDDKTQAAINEYMLKRDLEEKKESQL